MNGRSQCDAAPWCRGSTRRQHERAVDAGARGQLRPGRRCGPGGDEPARQAQRPVGGPGRRAADDPAGGRGSRGRPSPGRGFCAGADLGEFDRILGPTPADAVAGVGRYHELAEVLAGLSVPTVAAVNGPAVGGGAGLALLCDLRMFAASAQLWVNQVERAIVPDMGITWSLPRLVGASRAAAWMLLAAPVDASTALAAGLAHDVVPDADLVDAAVAVAGRLAALPPLALRMTRAMLAGSARCDLSDALRQEALAQAVCAGEPGFFGADVRQATGGDRAAGRSSHDDQRDDEHEHDEQEHDEEMER